MKIFALSTSKLFLNQELIKKIEKYGKLVYDFDKKPILEIEGMTDPQTEKILILSPLYLNWKLENEVIDKIPNLKAVILTSTSFSWIDIKYLASKGIPVMNGGSYSTNAVAEGAIMLALLTARKLPLIIQNDWKIDYSNHLGFELQNKTAGIVGLGNIGSRIAELTQAMGMKTTYWSRSSKDKRFEYVELEELFKNSDVIFISLASNSETENLITDEMLKSMKQNALFISITHKVYNHQLVNELVKQGKIFGFGNEEVEERTDQLDSNIWTGFASVWYTEDSLKRNADVILQALEHAVKGEFPKRVN